MILIQEILVAEDIIKEDFACNLTQCKGACCVEGDYGAPLTNDEIVTISKILDKVKPYLSEASIGQIEKNKFYTFNESRGHHETGLMEDGACVFMGRNPLGITFCSIEKSYYDDRVEFKKPISCHLYPIRETENRQTGFKAMNYDRWDICNAACQNGKKKKIKIFEFAKDALIRKYGSEFYDELEAAAKNYYEE